MRQEAQQAVRRQDRIDCMRSELDRLRRLQNHLPKVKALPEAWRAAAAQLPKAASGQLHLGARALHNCADQLEAALSTTTTPRRSL